MIHLLFEEGVFDVLGFDGMSGRVGDSLGSCASVRIAVAGSSLETSHAPSSRQKFNVSSV